MNNTENKRDTQFQGFANALWEEMEAIKCDGLVKGEHALDVQRKQREAIACHAYDLVLHTSSHIVEKVVNNTAYQRVPREDVANVIPDMTEFSEEQGNEQHGKQ